MEPHKISEEMWVLFSPTFSAGTIYTFPTAWAARMWLTTKGWDKYLGNGDFKIERIL